MLSTFIYFIYLLLHSLISICIYAYISYIHICMSVYIFIYTYVKCPASVSVSIHESLKYREENDPNTYEYVKEKY